jgi:hypothetical protein
LALLATTVFVLPALPDHRERIVVYGDIVYTLVLVSGVAIGWGRKRLFAVAICSSLQSLVMRWAIWVRPGVVNPIWSDLLSLIAIIVITYVLLAQVLREGPINLMRVLGAVAAYLLLGMAYAVAF